jgi:hypothetical protein
MSSDDEEKDSGEAVDSEQIEGGAEAAAAPAREEPADVRSSEARRRVRDQMQADIDAFLRGGGRIEKLEATASAQGTSITAGVNDLSQ